MSETPFSQRLENWLALQPEYMAVLGAPRAERRRIQRLVGKAVGTIPHTTEFTVNRAERRKVLGNIRKQNGQQLARVHVALQRAQKNAERVRRREARLSDERRLELEEQARAAYLAGVATAVREDDDPALD